MPDFIETRGYISLGDGGRQIYVDEYRKKVEGRILSIVEKHPALEALRKGQEVSEAQLIELERTLHRELGGAELELNSANIRKPDKYDRYLADVFLTTDDGEIFLNNTLLENGQAIRKDAWEFGDWEPDLVK